MDGGRRGRQRRPALSRRTRDRTGGRPPPGPRSGPRATRPPRHRHEAPGTAHGGMIGAMSTLVKRWLGSYDPCPCRPASRLAGADARPRDPATRLWGRADRQRLPIRRAACGNPLEADKVASNRCLRTQKCAGTGPVTGSRGAESVAVRVCGEDHRSSASPRALRAAVISASPFTSSGMLRAASALGSSARPLPGRKSSAAPRQLRPRLLRRSPGRCRPARSSRRRRAGRAPRTISVRRHRERLVPARDSSPRENRHRSRSGGGTDKNGPLDGRDPIGPADQLRSTHGDRQSGASNGAAQ
jgi:hypothetical protein